MRVLILLATALLAAGCIAPPGEDRQPGERTVNSGGDMTAAETRAESVDVCKDGVTLLGGEGQFCAERRVEVEGTISGISRMDVDLRTFNGAVEAFDDQEGHWGLTAVLRARGATADEAKRNLEKIAFSYAHEAAGSHFLTAEASTKDQRGNGLSASLHVTLPRSIAYVLVASTTNGGVAVKGLRTDGLSAHTTNGVVSVDADVTHVDLVTTNGDIQATLTPTSSGRVSALTTNGDVALTLPEDATRGYDLEARTTNGQVDVRLRDGATTNDQPSNPYYDANKEARFRTTDFGARRLQTTVTLVTTNGGVTVDPK